MTEKSWDRVPIDAQSIDAPLSRAAVFLVVTVANGQVALTNVCSMLDGLNDIVKTVGFRDLSARLSCIVGIGRDLWDRLHVDKRPQELKPFSPIHGMVHTAPATPGDLLFHIRSERPDACFEFARILLDSLGAGVTVIYNALGQLIEKTVGGVTTLLTYDEAGHLLGEYSSTGALIQETVWMDDTPVATLRPNGSAIAIYYVHTDHLNAPRIVTQSSSDNAPRWLWGGNAANQNPLGLGTFVYNLRYPGQYFQAETGLSYNYFRDYDPATGRYLESDPIRLGGGVNTYAYVGSNPISRIDPRGLFPLKVVPSDTLVSSPPGGNDGFTHPVVSIVSTGAQS